MPAVKPIVIMGAGTSGLTAGWELVKAGRDVVLWEGDPVAVGGLSRKVEINGFRFDLAGHRFFSRSEEINRLWHEILPDDLLPCRRHSHFYHGGKFFHQPLAARDALLKVGSFHGLKLAAGQLQARFHRTAADEGGFSQWGVNHFGRPFFEKFLLGLAEKRLGLPGDEISADWADLHFRDFDLPASLPGRREPPATFLHPRFGPGQMWETAARRLNEKGARLFYDRRVQTIHWDETGVTHITGTNRQGEFFQQEGESFISSLPLQELLLSLDPPPPPEIAAAARALRYRDLITVVLVVNRPEVGTDHWIEVAEPSLKVARVQNYKNWSPALVPDPQVTTLGLDYFCSEGDALAGMGERDLAQLAIREIGEMGLARADEIADAFVVRAARAFPVFDRKYRDHLDLIRPWVGMFANLQPVGRCGLHLDHRLDQAMMSGLLAARNVPDRRYDCWAIDAEAGIPPAVAVAS